MVILSVHKIDHVIYQSKPLAASVLVVLISYRQLLENRQQNLIILFLFASDELCASLKNAPNLSSADSLPISI